MNVKTLSFLYDPFSAYCTEEPAAGFNFPLTPLSLRMYSGDIFLFDVEILVITETLSLDST